MGDRDSLNLLLSELMVQHPKTTDDQLLDLYCAAIKEVPSLVDMALGRCFSEDMAFIRVFGLDEPEADDSWVAELDASLAAHRGVAALKATLKE